MNFEHSLRRPIGVFDSGIGGLTVLQALVRALPHEHFIYFGDTARLPYGEKSREAIVRFSVENARFLLEKDIKMLVVACNTATAYALEELRRHFDIPIVGVVQPGAEKALQATRTGRIAVLGTKGTIQSQVYQKVLAEKAPQAFVLPVACPLLVPLVEENYRDHPATRLIVDDYLKPLREEKIDTVLLGCTHYPLLKHLIAHSLGPDVAIVDSADACAENVAGLLSAHQLHSGSPAMPSPQYFVSDDPQKFQRLATALLNLPIAHIAHPIPPKWWFL